MAVGSVLARQDVELEDLYSISTPEGVTLDAVLAGIGSRFAALFVDLVLLTASAYVVTSVASLVLITLAIAGQGETASLWFVAVLAILTIALAVGYFVFMEAFNKGRNVGKLALGIRVVRSDGGPVGFRQALVRGIMRLLDFAIPVGFIVDIVSIVVSQRNQRLGDLLAGTLVVRTPGGLTKAAQRVNWNDPRPWHLPRWSRVTMIGPEWSGPPILYPGLPPELECWDVTGVSAGEFEALRLFLAHRWGYSPQARQRLAVMLANRLWPKVSGPAAPPPPEWFLEGVALVKAARS